MRKEERNTPVAHPCHMPPEIARLEEHWRDLWAILPPLADYKTLCAELHFKNAKSLSAVLCADPDAPRPVRVGRTAAFPRSQIVAWAAARAKNACRRGRKPAGQA